MSVLFKIVLGLALFWWWIFFGSRDHCPVCGSDLRIYYDDDNTLLASRLRRWCPCGWHE